MPTKNADSAVPGPPASNWARIVASDWGNGFARLRPLRSGVRIWRRLGLSSQFLITAGVALVLVSAADEFLRTRWTEKLFVKNSAEAASAYMGGIIAPHIQSSPDRHYAPVIEHALFDKVITDAGLKRQFERIKIWARDGTILYSTVEELTGRHFDLETVKRATRGEIVVATSNPRHDQDRLGSAKGKPMMEVYVPIRAADNSIIAVGEIHKDPDTLNEITSELIEGSLIIRAMSLLLGGLTLFVLVRRAQGTIARQRKQLRFHYRATSQLAQQNQSLRAVADDARRRSVKENEELLSRIGAEIHDGPIQLLSLAMLNLGAAAMAGHAPKQAGVTALMSQSITHLRNISTGLILPEIDDMLPEDALRLAIVRHEQMTGTEVQQQIAKLPPAISQGLKCCMYRIVQECLNNAVRHAEGLGQRVEVNHDGRNVSLTIADEGPGLSPPP